MILRRLVFDFFAKSLGFRFAVAVLLLAFFAGNFLKATAAEPPAYQVAALDKLKPSNPPKLAEIDPPAYNYIRPDAAVVPAATFQPSGPFLSTMAPKPVACTNCTQCGDSCQCFGGGYYCADGACQIQFNATAPISAPVQYQEVQVCENGKCRIIRVPVAQKSEPGSFPAYPTGYTPSQPTTVAGFSGGCSSCGTASSGYAAGGSCGSAASGHAHPVLYRLTHPFGGRLRAGGGRCCGN